MVLEFREHQDLIVLLLSVLLALPIYLLITKGSLA